MVVYVDESLLDNADRLPTPDLHNSEYLLWRQLDDYHDAVRATCGSEETIESLLNEWGAALLQRFDARSRGHCDRSDLKRIADFALCASRARDLRWRAYLRFAAVQEPEHVRRTFDSFIQLEFLKVSWGRFMQEVKPLGDMLGA
ncbi:MAG: hypothetical protein ACKV0T_05060 [Planctomycetales bacterium]